MEMKEEDPDADTEQEPDGNLKGLLYVNKNHSNAGETQQTPKRNNKTKLYKTQK